MYTIHTKIKQNSTGYQSLESTVIVLHLATHNSEDTAKQLMNIRAAMLSTVTSSSFYFLIFYQFQFLWKAQS